MTDQAAPETAVSETIPAAPAPEASAVPQPSAGALLRQAREAAGVDLAGLAQALKVPIKKLEALENDRFDQLPDFVFVRALASSVCRTLKIDASPVLQLLPQTGAPRLALDDDGLKTPFQMPSDVATVPFWDRLSRPMVLAALAILLGAMVLIFLPSAQRSELGAVMERSSPAPVPPVAEPAAVPQALEPAAAAPAVAVMPAVPAAAPVVAQTAVPTASPSAARPVAVAEDSPVAAEEEPKPRRKPASTGIVVFRTEGPSWVEVTDGRGNVQLSRLVEPGDVVGASGPLPLSVSVGRADVTRVEVRGQPFPLEPVTRQGVARFEVN